MVPMQYFAVCYYRALFNTIFGGSLLFNANSMTKVGPVITAI